jgi:hypothetical protein
LRRAAPSVNARSPRVATRAQRSSRLSRCGRQRPDKNYRSGPPRPSRARRTRRERGARQPASGFPRPCIPAHTIMSPCPADDVKQCFDPDTPPLPHGVALTCSGDVTSLSRIRTGTLGVRSRRMPRQPAPPGRGPASTTAAAGRCAPLLICAPRAGGNSRHHCRPPCGKLRHVALTIPWRAADASGTNRLAAWCVGGDMSGRAEQFAWMTLAGGWLVVFAVTAGVAHLVRPYRTR